ncbi:MAG: 7-carboxy-7-deazaguanine synthase QueE [Candidatus Omnitrophica bacterium]|nr:7-carboxy-7-deazaguanine synthase QueE [Candidatus Omnitrophota bacterium]MDD5518739.1 7-carboxy-7-deazaguanine synthase QueE [Candidatus Omnitrophota bacterium]
MKGKIAEVFDSVQGEGLYLGEKQIFVRFYGCNLGCRFCDTKLQSFMEYEPEELFQELKLYRDKYHSISFTGGEPLLQKDFLKELLKLTHKDNFKNYLETNGVLYEELKDIIEHLDFVAMDLKLPSSTGLGGFWEEHRLFLKIAAQREVFLKTVVCKDTTEDDLREGLRLIRETAQQAILILQPDSNEDRAHMRNKIENFKALCRRERVTVCAIDQIHKAIGVK